MPGVGGEVFLVLAGAVAGVIGTAGGITSLAAYPALLAVGVPPLAANMTNSVALLGSGLSSSLRAGPDVRGHRRTLRRWVPGTVVWGAMWPLGAGAVLGGLVGPSVARRVPAAALRIVIASCGLVLAGYLLVDAFA